MTTTIADGILLAVLVLFAIYLVLLNLNDFLEYRQRHKKERPIRSAFPKGYQTMGQYIEQNRK